MCRGRRCLTCGSGRGRRCGRAALLHGLGIALGVVLGELCLQTPGYRRFNRRRSGLDEFSHVLKLLKHGFAIDIQNLSQFVYAWFRH